MTGFNRVIKRYFAEGEIQEVNKEFQGYINKLGDFADRVAIKEAKHSIGWQWWYQYGTSAPKLRGLAMKILSQVTSSSSCERNWSTYDFIHSKKRNRLAPSKAEKLVYVFTNLRLSRKLKDDDTYERAIKWTHDGLEEASEGEDEEIEEGAGGEDSQDLEGDDTFGFRHSCDDES
jgi:hAT family C-terminal dimerisation region